MEGPERKLTVKGYGEISFDMVDGKRIAIGRRKMIHDETGTLLPYNLMLFGFGRKTTKAAKMSSTQRAYFGSSHDAHVTKFDDIEIARSKSGWSYLGYVRVINYSRGGVAYNGPWFHPFKPPQLLEKKGSWYRIVLPSWAVWNYRGIVKP